MDATNGWQTVETSLPPEGVYVLAWHKARGLAVIAKHARGRWISHLTNPGRNAISHWAEIAPPEGVPHAAGKCGKCGVLPREME